MICIYCIFSQVQTVYTVSTQIFESYIVYCQFADMSFLYKTPISQPKPQPYYVTQTVRGSLGSSSAYLKSIGFCNSLPKNLQLWKSDSSKIQIFQIIQHIRLFSWETLHPLKTSWVFPTNDPPRGHLRQLLPHTTSGSSQKQMDGWKYGRKGMGNR